MLSTFLVASLHWLWCFCICGNEMQWANEKNANPGRTGQVVQMLNLDGVDIGNCTNAELEEQNVWTSTKVPSLSGRRGKEGEANLSGSY